MYAFLGLGLLMLSDFRDEFLPGRWLVFENRKVVVRYSSYLAILFLVLYLGVFNGSRFIYFQF
jgi:hypothetical protein